MNRGRLLRALLLLCFGAVLVFLYARFVWEAPPETFVWRRGEQTLRLLEPRWLGVLLVAPALLWILTRSLADLPWQQRVLSWLLRLTFLGLLALGLGQLVETERVERVCAVALLDVSHSVADSSLREGRAYVEELWKARREEDELRLITFAERPREVPLTPGDGSSGENAPLALPPVPNLRHEEGGAATDLRAALQHAYGAFAPGCLRRIVVLSDGVETQGQVLSEAGRARELGIRIHARPLLEPPPPDVAVLGLEVPSKVNVGEPFQVGVRLHSTRPGQARLRLYQGEALNGLDSVRTVDLPAGAHLVEFRSVVRVGGEVTYSLELEPLGFEGAAGADDPARADPARADAFADNNRAAITVEVPGRPQVLYVEGQAGTASYLANALTAQQFDVDVRGPEAFPGNLAELERYAFVVVSDVARERLGREAERLIERYVRDVGGGFLFAGGPSGFGLGGWQGSGLERVLPVRMDSEKRREIPGVALVLVIDRSGSMTGQPMEMAKEACSATVTTLQGDDLIEVIAFDSTPLRYVKMQPARYRSRIQNDILRIQPGGGTEIFPSLDMAYQDISVVEARKKHVVLLTDGQARTDGLFDLATAMLAESITLTTVGLGGGTNDELLRMLADAGGGRYHPVQDPSSLPRVFTREAELISKQSTVEDWFPAQRVGNPAFLRGVSVQTAPLLRGYVSTQMKPAPAELILASDRGEPLLARWRVGLGWSLAWTSDVKNGWAIDWLRWPAFGQFWAQLVREHMRTDRRRELPMDVRVDEDDIVAVVQGLTEDERFDNAYESRLVVRRGKARGQAAPTDQPLEAAFQLTAPGRYEARVPAPGFGSFVVEAKHARRGPDGVARPLAVSYGHAARPYPREYASFEPNPELLRRLAEAGGGRIDVAPGAVFDPAGESIERHAPRQNRFILAALLVFLLDLLVRRVRLFDRRFQSRMSP